jgi:hypothetical protein
MFPPDEFDVYAIKGSLHKAEWPHHVPGDHVAILATCRTIYTEAKAILYYNTTFCIHLRDQYWLHERTQMWYDPDEYLEEFGLESVLDEPNSDDWIEHKPWLQDPHSIVPVSNIRSLSLDIECNTKMTAQKPTWTGQLKHTLRGASNIRKLYIALINPEDGNLY